jgi:hypothetical protein
MVDSETIIAPRTDSSASRFWGGTVAVFPLVAKVSLLRRGSPDLPAESSPSLDTGPADSHSPRSGTKSARAWQENHRPLLRAEELWLFAARVFQARFVPSAEARCLRYSFASATIVLTEAVVPPPTSTSTM